MTLNIVGFGDEVVYVSFLFFLLAIAFMTYVVMNRHLLSDFTSLLNRFAGFFYPFASAESDVQGDRDNQHEGYSNPNVQPTAGRAVYNADNNCPICLNACQYAVMSNCGHVYCCRCIIAYWRYGTWLNAIACPVCRAQVTLLMPNFSEAADLRDPERARASADLRSYNRRFSGQPRPLMDYVRDIPVVVPNLLGHLFTFGGLMLLFRLRIMLLLVAAALYILSPLDVLPEAFLGLFGLLDDLFVAFLMLIYLCVAYRQFLRT